MTRRAAAGCLAAAHLVFVAAGASGLFGRLGEAGAGPAVRWYGAMTGADAGYSYFAPHVGSELRVRFTLSDGRGREWEDDLTGRMNHEGRLRVGSMTGLFSPEPAREALRHDLAASWAATVFGRHPDARTVVVRVGVHEVPSMADFRAGRRPAWTDVFAATFTSQNADAPPEGPMKPEDWPQWFTRHLNAGDLEAVVALYEPGARFVTPDGGETLEGRDRIRPVLAGLIRAKTRMEGRVVRAVTADDIAILYSDFHGTTVNASGQTVEVHSKAIEVLRRQPDGTWKLIVGDPNGRR